MAELPEPIAHLSEAIYRTYAARRGSEGERSYLGMSTFGTECDRALWYAWRKAHPPEVFDGRKLRLFATGHREEARLIEDLRAIGVRIEEVDPQTGEQWAVSSLGGHLRGHLDGIATNVPDAPKTAHVLECKTHGDKSYKELIKHGVEKSKPGHYAQMQLYMHHEGVDRALYVAVNKNDDSIFTQRVAYDRQVAERLIGRARRIIQATNAPAKLFDDPTSKAAFVCQWCPALAVCHEGALAQFNCRTCLHSTPVVDDSDNATWHCELHERDLSLAEQAAGCPQHLYLPSLVPGEQIDADEYSVTYQMPDGTTWVDEAVPCS